MSTMDTKISNMFWELHDVCTLFIRDNNVTCAEATVEDRVYENAPVLIEKIAKIIGYYDGWDDDKQESKDEQHTCIK